MKYSYLLILLAGLICFQCDSESDDNGLDANCGILQEDIDDATSQKLTAFEAYTQNTGDSEVCQQYADALVNRIEKMQAYLDTGCADSNAAIKLNLQTAINEDQESLEGLDCK